MLYTVVGDPHITPESSELFDKLFDLVEAKRQPTIWLGDMLDTKELIRGKCLNLLFNKLRNSKNNHYILVGNHDYFNLECKDHSLRVLTALPNVTIVDEPLFLDNALLIPYIDNLDELKKIIKDSKSKALFAHLELSGYDYGTGLVCKSGLTKKDLSKFDLVVSGHFHKHQEFYLGTPYTTSYGESDQDKFIATFDSDTLTLELEKTNFPTHRTLVATELTEDLIQKIKVVAKKDKLRLVLKGTPEQVDLLSSDLKKLNIQEKIKVVKLAEKPSNQIAPPKEVLSVDKSFAYWNVQTKRLSKECEDLALSILRGVV